VYRVLMRRPEEQKPLGRPRHRWQDNIKMILREVGWGCTHWIDVVQDRYRWRSFVNAAMKLRVS